MTTPPAPTPPSAAEQEHRRLARLKMLSVLDTEPEPVFDALVRIAAAVCGAPIALISLVDADRQWFKANQGLAGVAETPRDVAFCDHAIRGNEILEVPDATQDPRFVANPLVTGDPNIRFYAGAPIAMPTGERIGTLCVIDRRPGGLNPAQQQALRDLASVAQWALLQRERLHELTVVGDESRFQAVSYASPMGIFQADEHGAIFHSSGRMQEMLGLPQERVLGLGWQDVVIPQDREAVARGWQEAVAAARPLDREFCVQRPDGSKLYVRMQARPGSWGEPPRNGFVGVLGDITQRKDAFDKQQAAYALLSSVLENLPCGLSVFNAELRLVAHNQHFQALMELPDRLLEGQPRFQDLIRFYAERGDYGPGDVDEHVRRIVANFTDPTHLHVLRTQPDGRTLDMHRALLPDGGFVTTYVDITPARAAEQALRDSEERQKRALDSSRLALWELDLDSGWMYLSENWSQLLGGPATPTITTALALTDLVPQEERAPLTAALTAMLKGQTDRYVMEHRVRRKDGTFAWIHSEGRVTKRGPGGEALYATGTNQDVTARKTVELELERSAAITRATVEAAADGIMVVDADRKVLLHNRRLQQMWDMPPRLEGADSLQLARQVQPLLVDAAGYMQRLQEIRETGAADSFDELQFHDGRVYERHSRRIDLDGRHGRVWTFHDATAQRKADQELHAAKEAAEAANRAKTDFLDNVSHEIRTPLNGVLGLTRLLLAEDLSEQQRRYVQLADASAASLLELMNDLLDLGKIEAGRMELEDAPFRLDELLMQLGDLYQLRAEEKGLRFELEIAPGVPSSVAGDAGRLRQILNNLLSNALKFTDEGGFGLIVGRPGGTLGLDVIRFTVYDTGIGIPYDVQKRLFTRFTQAERSTSRKYGGTGLGLAIVKQLSGQMGGDVLLQSEPGRGASFRCDLPLRASREPVASMAPVPQRTAGAQLARILVAEDNPTNQVVVRGLLAQAGYRNVTVVEDGQQAVDAALAGDFDLVLMDCRMPVLDGYGATMQLRARGFTAPVIALTANAAAGERERCLAHGMNDYLAKPIAAARLAQVLAEWTVDTSPAAAAAAAVLASAAPAGNAERQQALERLGGDEELLAVAVGSFREHAPKVLQAARAALAAGNLAELHRHLHSLSGSSGMVGAESVRELARELEAEAREGRLQEAGRGLGELAVRCDAFLAEAATW